MVPARLPGGTFWAVESTSDADVERYLGGDRARRVHAIEASWLADVREASLFAYRLPRDSFRRYERAAGYWVSRSAVEPLEVVELGDLLAKHAAAGIELRIVPALLPLWDRIIGSTLEFSGIRLRNLAGSPG